MRIKVISLGRPTRRRSKLDLPLPHPTTQRLRLLLLPLNLIRPPLLRLRQPLHEPPFFEVQTLCVPDVGRKVGDFLVFDAGPVDEGGVEVRVAEGAVGHEGVVEVFGGCGVVF